MSSRPSQPGTGIDVLVVLPAGVSRSFDCVQERTGELLDGSVWHVVGEGSHDAFCPILCSADEGSFSLRRQWNRCRPVTSVAVP